MILDPWGQILARIDSGPGAVWADIDLQQLRTVRSHFPALAHRRLDYARA
jgi:nitrilase